MLVKSKIDIVEPLKKVWSSEVDAQNLWEFQCVNLFTYAISKCTTISMAGPHSKRKYSYN